MLLLLAACARPPSAAGDDTAAGYQGTCTATALAYEDVAPAWGLTDTTDDLPYPHGGSGLAVADLDEDGADDVVLAIRGDTAVIHWNRGGALEAERLDLPVHPTATAALDVDGDRHLDLLVAGALADDENQHQLYLLRGDGAGTFAAPEAVGIGSSGVLTIDAADYDHDGDPDVYVASASRDALYRNDDGTLVSAGEPLLSLSDWTFYSWAGVWLDADGDGWDDLLVANDLQSTEGSTRFYRNANGTFTAADPPITINAMGASTIDYDRDGDPDVFIPGTGPDGLYANDGGWIDVSAVSGAAGSNPLGRMHLGSAAADLDNDGWTDLAVVGGRFGADDALLANQDVVEPDSILLDVDGQFTAADVGFVDDADGTGVVPADLDGDGTLELVVGGLGVPSHIWRSPCLARYSLEIELVDPAGDPYGLGATVTAHTADGDRYGRVGLATGLFGARPPRAWIGLGTAALEGLTVRWPDGEEQEVATTETGRVVITRE